MNKILYFGKKALKNYWNAALWALSLLLFWILPIWLLSNQSQMAWIDPSFICLIFIAISVYLFLLNLCWGLINQFFYRLDLPDLYTMVSQFNDLKLWQQMCLYLAAFALLLLSAIACIAAIC